LLASTNASRQVGGMPATHLTKGVPHPSRYRRAQASAGAQLQEDARLVAERCFEEMEHSADSIGLEVGGLSLRATDAAVSLTQRACPALSAGL
jgi:hypothetical protein